MRRRNRIFALFLAIALVFTSLALDFEKAIVVNADSDTTESAVEAAAETTQPGKIEFDNIDVTTLDDKGFTATRFSSSNNYAIVGEADQRVGTYWVTGSDVTSSNAGLKPNAVQADSTMTILNTPYSYEDFRISTEVYWGASTGIVLGDKNVFPTSSVDSSVRIYFNANQIQLVGGGVDYTTAEVTGGTASWNTGYAPTYIFKPDKNYKNTDRAVFQLNIKLENNTLMVWLEGYDGVLTVEMSETYKNESIALVARNYDGDGGGLKSLEVRNLDLDGYVDFDNMDVSILTEKCM